MTALDIVFVLFILGVVLLLGLGAGIEHLFTRTPNRSRRYVRPKSRKGKSLR